MCCFRIFIYINGLMSIVQTLAVAFSRHAQIERARLAKARASSMLRMILRLLSDARCHWTARP
jgi:hypothetical protein